MKDIFNQLAHQEMPYLKDLISILLGINSKGCQIRDFNTTLVPQELKIDLRVEP